MKSTRFGWFVVCMVFVSTGFGQVVDKLQQAQVAAVDHLRAKLAAPAGTVPAFEIKLWTENVSAIQRVELSTYDLVAARARAVQETTRPVWEKAKKVAEEVGVSSKLLAAITTDWETAQSQEEAESVILALVEATRSEIKTTSQKGWFTRKVLPAWAGGTTRYADYLAPSLEDIARAQSLAAVSRSVGTRQSPPVE